MSLDPTLNRVLEELANHGILGKNKAEVAVSILWKWIWDNEDKLGRQGIQLVIKNGPQ
ncbi:MAG TPA: hypothetical protein VMI94_01910 [Bryobacteraceae bacterium]|nr:hypothetical protein [Bryobacteraceae bacterium]